jgi:hypothetical protein
MHSASEKVFLAVIAMGAATLGGVLLGLNHKATVANVDRTIEVRAAPIPIKSEGAGRIARIAQNDLAETPAQSYGLAWFQPARAETGSNRSVPSEPSHTKLSTREVRDLADRCAPTVPASVLVSIAKVESGDVPLTIVQNGNPHLVFRPASKIDALKLATRLIASGRNIDLGIAQINSRNLGWLGLSPEDALDPCKNFAAAAKIIDRGYLAALKLSPQNRPLLQTAFSLYNTGDANLGLINGYVARVEAARRE